MVRFILVESLSKRQLPIIAGSHLINTRSGVEWGERKKMARNARKRNKREQPIFGPVTSLFVGHRALGPCSLLTPRGRPKSLAAPSASIYEMTSYHLTGYYVSVGNYGVGICPGQRKSAD
jgi:hypothetical protein